MQNTFYSYHDYYLERNPGFSTIKLVYLKPLTEVFIKENRIRFLLADCSVSCLFFPPPSFAPQNEHLAASLARMQNGSQGEGSTFQKSMINIPWLSNSTGLNPTLSPGPRALTFLAVSSHTLCRNQFLWVKYSTYESRLKFTIFVRLLQSGFFHFFLTLH